MHEFTLHIPTKFVFGNGVFQRAGKEIRKKAEKVLIVCSSGSVIRLGYLDALLNQLETSGIRADVFDKVMPNPRVSMVDAGGRLAKNLHVDAVIGFGGGSAMDAAKGVAIVAKNDTSIWDYCAGQKTTHQSLPVICIPTLSATGSEGNAFGVVTHDETLDKSGFVCYGARPVLSVIDPELTLSVPRDYLLDGAVDIITHATEAYFSSRHEGELNDKISLAITESVVKMLDRLLNNPADAEARAAFAWASTLALIGINEAGREGPHTIHVIEHALSGMFDISHGRGLALVFPHYLEMFREQIGEKLVPFGQIFNPAANGPEEGIAAFGEWLRRIGRNLTFKDFGIPSDAVPALAESVLRTAGNRHHQVSAPVPMEKATIEKLYRMCL
ncbi:MAG: iron-containing alcohol dehydrogenase [Candidatus Neomarinimicrobiota bacterium]|jgi:alcohol dehydrogenase YqhD (iron-dependent ADH family)|nr:iron-containing alcohol dehydrogenase [Candidatus Neomarinimicrobiota bacterium]MDX9780080.1 iron-containing alcohol dehydrogenase [bacterium]